MLSISSITFDQIKHYSDWRLYPDDLPRTSALQGLAVEGQALQTTGRDWITFEAMPDDVRGFASLLLEACCASRQWTSFAVEFVVDDTARTIRFRVQSLGGFFACRLLFSVPTTLDDITGVTPEVREFIMSHHLSVQGGLVLMVGNAGTGKSVFASSAMRQRLQTYGGHLVVVGDPPEQPVGDGGLSRVGRLGYVDTVDVCEIGYTQALSMVLRSYPTGKKGSLLFSEIRSDSNAFDLVNSAINGHVVFATMHGISPDAALDRLISWCVRGGVPIDVVRNMLSQSLYGITFHRHEHGKFQITAYPSTDETRKKIRDGYPLPFKATAVLKFNVLESKG